MYLVGALAVVGSREVAIVLGGAIAVLLHLREELKEMVTRMSDRDVRAIMQFVLISLVILPTIPDQFYGPYQVLNPRQIWWMVVLIVGLKPRRVRGVSVPGRQGWDSPGRHSRRSDLEHCDDGQLFQNHQDGR